MRSSINPQHDTGGNIPCVINHISFFAVEVPQDRSIVMTVIYCIDEEFGSTVSESKLLHQLIISFDIPCPFFKNVPLINVTATIQSHTQMFAGVYPWQLISTKLQITQLMLFQ